VLGEPVVLAPAARAAALEGKLDLGRMVTRRIALDDVQNTLRELEHSEVIRSVVQFGR
jgi:Zn-dependent alcohol dehydrogenase